MTTTPQFDVQAEEVGADVRDYVGGCVEDLPLFRAGEMSADISWEALSSRSVLVRGARKSGRVL
jgi:hypothetical protein